MCSYVFDLSPDKEGPIGDATVNAVVTHLQCSPTDDNAYATCGKKHCNFYAISDGEKGKKNVKCTKGKGFDNQNIAAVAYSK